MVRNSTHGSSSRFCCRVRRNSTPSWRVHLCIAKSNERHQSATALSVCPRLSRRVYDMTAIPVSTQVSWNKDGAIATGIPAGGSKSTKMVAANRCAFAALHTDGTVTAWHADASNELSEGACECEPPDSLANVKSLAASSFTYRARLGRNRPVCCPRSLRHFVESVVLFGRFNSIQKISLFLLDSVSLHGRTSAHRHTHGNRFTWLLCCRVACI